MPDTLWMCKYPSCLIKLSGSGTSKLWPVHHIGPVARFCTARELKMVFTFLSGWKNSKEDTWNLNFSVCQAVLLAHSHAHSFRCCHGCFCTSTTELNSYDRDHMAHRLRYLLSPSIIGRLLTSGLDRVPVSACQGHMTRRTTENDLHFTEVVILSWRSWTNFFFFFPNVFQMPSLIRCTTFERHSTKYSWHMIHLSIAQMDFRIFPTFQ